MLAHGDTQGYFKTHADLTPCLPCPDFATCPGGWALPQALPGYYRAPSNDFMMQCDPVDACVGGGNNTCANGYAGLRCGICQVRCCVF